MIIFAMIYTVASGLYGVVWTDVFQSILNLYLCYGNNTISPAR